LKDILGGGDIQGQLKDLVESKKLLNSIKDIIGGGDP
jgi:hypothetical protein